MWLSFVIMIIIILLIVYAILAIGTKKDMPKIPKHYKDFSGGLNSQKDPRDIADNELSDVNNMIGDQGQLRTMGALAAATGVTGTTDALAVKCYGLFVFSSDYDMPSNGSIVGVADNGSGYARYETSAQTLATGDWVFHYGCTDTVYNGYKEITWIDGTHYDTTDTFTDDDTGTYVEVSEAATTGEDYLAVADADAEANVDIMPLSDDTFHKGMIDLGTTTGAKMVFYYAGGALRVCDANFGTNNSNRWLGYIKRVDYNNSLYCTPLTIDRWVEASSEIAKPTRGIVGESMWEDSAYDANCTSTNVKIAEATGYAEFFAELNLKDDYLVAMGSTLGNARIRVIDGNAADSDEVGMSASQKLDLAITAGSFTDGGGGTVNINYNGHGLVNTEYVEVEGTTNYNGTYSVTWVDANNVKITIAWVADETGDVRKTWRWNAAYYIFPPIGTGFSIRTISTVVAGTWEATELEFAESFVYVGGQESLLHRLSGTYTPTADKMMAIVVGFVQHFDPRITGGRIYYREHNSEDSWKFLVDIDLSTGVKSKLTVDTLSSSLSWNDAGKDTVDVDGVTRTFVTATAYSYGPEAITYEAINGYSVDEVSLYAEYKTACIGNSRSWIGNVKTANSSGDDVVYNDRVMHSPPGKYDVHPTSFYIDILPNDGDKVIAVQFFADRLLVFKKEKLYIVNVAHGSDTGWFIEDTKSYMGVKTPAATFRTDYGIVWVNENGCFIFNGETVINLIQYVESGMQQYKIKPSTWATFITDDAVVGFDPQTKKIIVVGDADAATGYCYIYDTATRSWWKGDKFSQDASHLMTNFAILNNELIIGRYSD